MIWIDKIPFIRYLLIKHLMDEILAIQIWRSVLFEKRIAFFNSMELKQLQSKLMHYNPLNT